MRDWIFYTIPGERIIHYFLCLYLALFIIPEYILGMAFTIPMQFLNFMWYDILYYVFLKMEKFND